MLICEPDLKVIEMSNSRDEEAFWRVRATKMQTEADARQFIRSSLASMSHSDLLQILAQIEDSNEKQWLLNLIFSEVESSKR
jgi:hypothetical protein